MKNFVLILVGFVAFLIPPQAKAQDFYRHSSTAQEGYYRGLGSAYRGYGSYLRDRGEYEVLHQDAYRGALENERQRIRYWWEIRDEWATRNAIKSEERRKRQSAYSQTLKKRANDTEYGPAIVFDGRVFNSFEELRQDELYQLRRAAR
jgi:hypothetical protein